MVVFSNNITIEGFYNPRLFGAVEDDRSGEISGSDLG
jgi:hypothetical protein